MPTRTDTSPQSEAAEVRTVAELLDRGLVAGQYPRNYPDLDVFAFDASVKRVIGIQVKYRHAASASDVRFSRLGGVDFFVLYRANRSQPVGGRTSMQCWVVPASAVDGETIRFNALPDEYLNAWALIERAAGKTISPSA